MRTHITEKSYFVNKRYPDIKKGTVRLALTILGISAKNLAIERGRYTRTPKKEYGDINYVG